MKQLIYFKKSEVLELLNSIPTIIELSEGSKDCPTHHFFILDRLIQITLFYHTENIELVEKILLNSRYAHLSFSPECYKLSDLNDHIKNTPITTFGSLILLSYNKTKETYQNTGYNIKCNMSYAAMEVWFDKNIMIRITHVWKRDNFTTEITDKKTKLITSEIPMSSLSDPNLIDDIIKELISKNPPNANLFIESQNV